MPDIRKKEADAYDRLIDAAAELAELIDENRIEMDEYALEELTIFLAQHKLQLKKIIGHLKYTWP